jgi:hypothetical protein
MADVRCKECKATAVDLKITVPQSVTKTVAALPGADFPIVTWTAAEAGMMATVFGKDSYHFDGADDNHLTPLILPNLTLPSGEKCHAHFFLSTVNGKSVVCLKSEFHPKGQTAATTMFFERIIGSSSSPRFKYAITSGTSGGIWQSLDPGMWLSPIPPVTA